MNDCMCIGGWDGPDAICYKALWEGLKAWAQDDYVRGVEGALYGSRATWDKMTELEAAQGEQRYE